MGGERQKKGGGRNKQTKQGKDKGKEKKACEGKCVKEGDGRAETSSCSLREEGVSTYTNTDKKTNQSPHSGCVESTSARAHKKTNRALGFLNPILTMLLWLSWPQAGCCLICCVTADSWREIPSYTMQRCQNVRWLFKIFSFCEFVSFQFRKRNCIILFFFKQAHFNCQQLFLGNFSPS